MVHTQRLEEWQHDHVSDRDRKSAGERRTLVVVAMTAGMTTRLEGTLIGDDLRRATNRAINYV